MPPKRSRKFSHKVKTGCQTCRIRRVKCDEQKPSCQKCVSTGRKCDGYNQSLVNGQPSGPLVVQQDDIQERQGFHFFCTQTSREFSALSESSFWSRIVLQACQVNSSLRHAAVALATLHREFLSHLQREAQSASQPQSDDSLALRQYGKALQKTRRSMEDGKRPLVTTLMSCILFSCFESLRGKLAFAVIHLRSALNILSSSQKQIESSSYSSKSVIREELSNVMGRLGFQANYFIDKTHPINQLQLTHSLQNLDNPQVGRISTIDEAQVALFALFNKTMFAGHAEDQEPDTNSFRTEYHLTKCAQLILSGDSSPRSQKGRTKAIRVLSQWNTAFKAFLQTQGSSMTGMDVQRVKLLRLHHSVAMLMLTAGGSSSKNRDNVETTLRGFKNILELANSLIATTQSPVGPIISAFSPDLGIIAPMFFVATKCPDPVLRNEAKNILESNPRREGMWDSVTAVNIIDHLENKSLHPMTGKLLLR